MDLIAATRAEGGLVSFKTTVESEFLHPQNKQYPKPITEPKYQKFSLDFSLLDFLILKIWWDLLFKSI